MSFSGDESVTVRDTGKVAEAEISDASRKRAAVELIRNHERTLKRTARRYSFCEDDADDAYQRSLEILLTKAPTVHQRDLIRWMQTVTKHEALAVRRHRERLVSPAPPGDSSPEDQDWIQLIPSPNDGPADLAERREKVARSREALSTLKPQELRALTLLAEGYSYREISGITGWTRTKINRCLAEGRQRFRSVIASSEGGERCDDLNLALSAFADGEASEKQVLSVREHLRVCAYCRAKLRTFRAAPRAAAALLPALPFSRSFGERIQEAYVAIQTRLPWRGSGDSPAVQVAASGGTRGAGTAMVAKVLTACVGTAGGAAACVATGVIETPFNDGQKEPVQVVAERSAKAPAKLYDEVAPPPPAPVVPAPDTEPAPENGAEPAPAEEEPASPPPRRRPPRSRRSRPHRHRRLSRWSSPPRHRSVLNRHRRRPLSRRLLPPLRTATAQADPGPVSSGHDINVRRNLGTRPRAIVKLRNPKSASNRIGEKMGSRHALIVSYLALFVALGGSAAALSGRFSVKADDLATASVGERAVRHGAIGRPELRTNSVFSRHLGTGVVHRRELGIASVTSTAIRNRTVGSFDLGVQSRIDFPLRRAIDGVDGLRLIGGRVLMSPAEGTSAPFEFLSEGESGGSVHLDGSLAPGSGYLRFTETSETPDTYSDSVSLVHERGRWDDRTCGAASHWSSRATGSLKFAILLLGVPISFGVDSARAGDFQVKNCIDEVPLYSMAALYEGGERVARRRCDEPESQGLFQLNGRPGHSAKGEHGSWVWRAGEGSGFVGGTIRARLRSSGGWGAQLYAVPNFGEPHVFGTPQETTSNQNYSFFEPAVGAPGARSVHARLMCHRDGGCDLNELGGATNRPDNVLLEVRDWLAPTAYVTGEILSEEASNRWHRGVKDAVIGGVDGGSGIRAVVLRVTGELLGLRQTSCPGDRGNYAIDPRPCPETAILPVQIETRRIANGVNSVEFCAVDYGFPLGNVGCTQPYTLKIDNEAPQQPEGLATDRAGAWQANNDFDVSWSNPPQGATAPITAYRFRLLNSGGEVVEGPTRVESSQAHLEDVAVPRPGAWTLEVMLEDAAGNVGAPARTTLRFDDQRPGFAPPATPDGWISRTEIPLVLRILRPAEPLPVSGIEGYAYSVDRSPESQPCADVVCTNAETDLRGGIDANTFEISDLPEGTSYVHTVAVSRSGMSSLEVGHTPLQVDKTDAVTSLQGAEAGWTNEPVALRATAVDSGSGMTPAAGQTDPFTAIRVDDSAPVTSTGNTVTTALTDDGVHTVAYFARDLAGNLDDGATVGGVQNNPPRTTQVRIDRSQPGVAFVNAQSPDDPELIRAMVIDPLAGPDPARGSIAVRRVGRAGAFTQLPTEFVDGLLQARWPSDTFAAGEYEFRVTAADRAGNVSTTGRRADGSEMVLPNPVKLPTSIRAGFSAAPRFGRRRQLTVGFNQRVVFRGRLTAGLGSALGGETVEIVERFAEGSALEKRVTRVRTDRRGALLGPPQWWPDASHHCCLCRDTYFDALYLKRRKAHGALRPDLLSVFADRRGWRPAGCLLRSSP